MTFVQAIFDVFFSYFLSHTIYTRWAAHVVWYILECSLYVMFEFRKIRTSYHRISSSITPKNQPILKINLIKLCKDRNIYLHVYIVKKIVWILPPLKSFLTALFDWLMNILCYCYVSHTETEITRNNWCYNNKRHRPITLNRQITWQNSNNFFTE